MLTIENGVGKYTIDGVTIFVAECNTRYALQSMTDVDVSVMSRQLDLELSRRDATLCAVYVTECDTHGPYVCALLSRRGGAIDIPMWYDDVNVRWCIHLITPVTKTENMIQTALDNNNLMGYDVTTMSRQLDERMARHDATLCVVYISPENYIRVLLRMNGRVVRMYRYGGLWRCDNVNGINITRSRIAKKYGVI